MTVAASRELLVVLAIASTFAAGVIAASLYSAVVHRRRARRARASAARARDALTLLGDALASTHNPRALLSVILDATLEATGAGAGRVVAGNEAILGVGEPSRETPLVFELGHADAAAGSMQLVLFPPPGGLAPEVEQLASSIVRQGRIALDNARLHRFVEEQALTDDLTGLPNRRRFIQALDGEVSRTERFGGSFSVIVADLDDFKTVNDRYGHESGDLVLRQVAQVLRASLRDVDLPARLGGEEFGVLVPEADARGARAAAERIRHALKSHPISLGPGVQIIVTASFGLASYPLWSRPDDLLRAADVALYRSKSRGKDAISDGDEEERPTGVRE